MSVNPQDGETPNRIQVDGQWTAPDELERRAHRERQRAEQQQRQQQRNERRRVDFNFGSEDSDGGSAFDKAMARHLHDLGLDS
jgi:hypothetical protein